jgi:TolB protein
MQHITLRVTRRPSNGEAGGRVAESHPPLSAGNVGGPAPEPDAGRGTTSQATGAPGAARATGSTRADASPSGGGRSQATNISCRQRRMTAPIPGRAPARASAGALAGALSLAVARAVALSLGIALAVTLAAPASAQVPTEMPRGVQLKLVYETQFRPRLAVQPFTVGGGGPGAAEAAGARRGGGRLGTVAEEVHRIVQRDLDYSDRFDMMFNIPARLQTGVGDYGAWNALGVVYLVTGSVEETDSGYGLRLALHDVVYGSVKEIRQFRLPGASDPDYRMAVHAAADEVVRWATGEPGAAATRIALSRQLSDGTYELLVVDSDGENLRRVHTNELIYSPAWSPDGRRLAYNEADESGHHRVVERNLSTGEIRVITERGVPAQTPAYSPDGRKLAFGLWVGGGMEIHEYDIGRNCCIRRLSQRSRIDMGPSYSPDGRRIVFQSDRLGNPHIFTMPADGGEAVLVTPYEAGGPGYFTSPAWSPKGSQIVFHGRSRGGIFQVMVADANRPGTPVQQITSEGRSEDPAWAPDGRHVVFSGVRNDGMGLYVIDVVTGRIRPLVTGGRFRMPDWSPVLRQASGQTGSR